jgi:GAF domain-containing protein
VGIVVFTPAPKPVDEFMRSKAAARSSLLAASANSRVASVAMEMRQRFGVRWSGICVIYDECQHVVASSGGMLGLYQRSTSLGSYVVAFPDNPLCILDTSEDERFAGNPFVTDGLIGFYAGAAILDKDGYAIGALCVTNPYPQSIVDPKSLQYLQAVARSLVANLE